MCENTPDPYRSGIDREIDDNLKQLEAVLRSYRTIRTNEKLLAELLLSTDRTLATNFELLHDAALLTRDLKTPVEQNKHEDAKAALLLWCVICCEKYLLKIYPSSRTASREAIVQGAKIGVSRGFEAIRQRVNEYFALPETERGEHPLPSGSVRRTLLLWARHNTQDEFGGEEKDLIDIEKKIADSPRHRKLRKSMSKEEFAEFMHKEVEAAVEEYRRQGVTVIENRGRPCVYKCDYVPFDMAEGDDDSASTIQITDELSIPVDDIIASGEELMDKTAAAKWLGDILAHLRAMGQLTQLEDEFLQRVFLKDSEKPSEVQAEWDRRGIDYGGNIYNFKRTLQTKLFRAIRKSPGSQEMLNILLRK